MDRLRPQYWFSAHLHCKFAASIQHEDGHGQKGKVANSAQEARQSDGKADLNQDEIDLDMDDGDEPKATEFTQLDLANAEEIDLELEEDDTPAPVANVAAGQGLDGVKVSLTGPSEPSTLPEIPTVSADLRAQLPAAFARPSAQSHDLPQNHTSVPPGVTNRTTRFLALDKCLPNRDFLQLLAIPSLTSDWSDVQRPVRLEYDKEWLAITRVLAQDLVLGDINARPAADKGEDHYRPLIEAEEEWVEQNLVQAGRMMVPENFEITAPVYDPSRGLQVDAAPLEYSNNQTRVFCHKLQIPNPFKLSDEERERRMQAGPRPEELRRDVAFQGGERGRGRGGGFGRGGGRGGHRGRGRGFR